MIETVCAKYWRTDVVPTNWFKKGKVLVMGGCAGIQKHRPSHRVPVLLWRLWDMVDTHIPVEPVDLTPWTAGLIPPPSSGLLEGFVRQAFNWFCALRWFSGRSPGPVRDIS